MKTSELKEKIDKIGLVDTKKLNKKELETLLEKLEQYKKSKIDDYRTFKFGDDVVQINNEQYNIVTADINSNIRVVACAGSGKTTTIVCRIKYLIDHGVNPSDIMLTTFNVDAATSMKEKIKKIFGFLPNILVGTIDSICCKYYYKYCRDINYVSVREYSTRILAYMKTNTTIQNQTKYLFFDEFQDCNDTQFELLIEYYKHGAKITVIGDDAQNIYQWRGSNIGFIMNLNSIVPSLVTYKLCINYRSTPEIIKMANASIVNNQDQIPKEMIAIKKTIDFKPLIKHFKNDGLQMKCIIKTIEEFVANGVNPDQIAILSRNGYPLKIFEEKLEKYNKKHDSQINYIALITDENQDAKPKGRADHLTLTTIHKSKGLEWKIVFLINCEDKYFPNDLNKIALEEERRLFYVAVTRAKEYLYIFFTTDQISRFVGEIDRKYYNFEDFDAKYFNYDDSRMPKYDNSVVKLVQMLNVKDIEYLRINKILPEIEPEIKKIHNEHVLNPNINNYYLHADYGEFIDRYITRMFGQYNEKSGGLVDNAAECVIGSVELKRDEYDIYSKYLRPYKKNIDAFVSIYVNKARTIGTADDIEEFISKNLDEQVVMDNLFRSINIKKTQDKLCKSVISIMKKIITGMIRNKKLSIDQLMIIPTSYLPKEFKQTMEQSYEIYKDGENRTHNIMERCIRYHCVVIY
jgi:superfamily I DNA/RNA helicase